jgi:enoyl-CoA hydratase
MDEVLIERVGRAGVLTLNRPKALNALTHHMIRAIDAALAAWAGDASVTRVIIRQTGEKAFCAGGDIRAIAGDIADGGFDAVEAFYRDEYRLNRRIARYAKPFVALIDGIVMGGGVGVSFHGAHRVAGDRLLFAMPEVGIGLFPDVGATYLLPRLPGRTGLYLALTGARIGPADAVWAGLATARVPSADFPLLFDALCAGGDVDAAIAALSVGAESSSLEAEAPARDALLDAPDLAALLARVEDRASAGDGLAIAMRDTLATRSPTSVALAFEQMRRGGDLDIEDALRLEYRIVTRVIRGPDFPEGVRAVILDKDNRPAWRPARFADLDPAEIARHFDPAPGGDLTFPP